MSQRHLLAPHEHADDWRSASLAVPLTVLKVVLIDTLTGAVRRR